LITIYQTVSMKWNLLMSQWLKQSFPLIDLITFWGFLSLNAFV
jgi:hypothetical protein